MPEEVTFSRTPAGLANYHLFLNTEFVVFCEGGQSIAGIKDDISTRDQAFWRKVLPKVLGTESFRLIPCGPRREVLHRVEQAYSGTKISRQKNTVYGCIDRDYVDVERNAESWFDYVVTTYGYSFESDLLWIVRLEKIAEFFYPRLSVKDRKILESILSKLSRLLGRVTLIDRGFRAVRVSFLPDQSLPSFVYELRAHLATDAEAAVDQRMMALYWEFRKKFLKKHGARCYREIRSGRTHYHDTDTKALLEGIFDCPEKLSVRSLVFIVNSIGNNIKCWPKINDGLVLDFCLAMMDVHLESRLKGRLYERRRSWVVRASDTITKKNGAGLSMAASK